MVSRDSFKVFSIIQEERDGMFKHVHESYNDYHHKLLIDVINRSGFYTKFRLLEFRDIIKQSYERS